MGDENQWALPAFEVSVMLCPMKKSVCMKTFLVVSAALALPYTSVAATIASVDAPVPAYADLETSAEAAMPLPVRLARTFKLSLSLDAAVTNNAEIVFGTGACDDPEDTSVVIGFDRGAWFLRGDALRKRFSSGTPAPFVAGPKTLVVSVRLGEGGAPVGVTFHADGAPVTFTGLDAGTLLAWLDPRGWETFRVTSRGEAGNVTASVKFLADGSVFILR